MHIIRNVQAKDFDPLLHLIRAADFGMTNLSQTPDKIKCNMEEAFQAIETYTPNQNQKYLFLLEDLDTHTIGGYCGIFSQIADLKKPHYKIESIPQPQLFPEAPTTTSVLVPAIFQTPASEVCSLYMQPEWRHKGVGKLLSLSRFLFIGLFPERFQAKIIAEIRGFTTPKGIAPLWDGIGRQFFQVSYPTLLTFCNAHPELIASLLPKYPIYLSLLPPSIQKLIGMPHPNAEPALNMLTKQGFVFNQQIDPFDGGPWIEAATTEIKTISQKKTALISKIDENHLSTYKGVLCNGKLDFRACYGNWTVTEHAGVIISRLVAEALQVEPGEKITFANQAPITP